MRDVSLIHKELAEMTGMKARLGQPPEDPHVQDLLSQIAEHEARLAELKRQIAELEAKIGWTAEEEAGRANLQRLIDAEETNVHNWQNKISELEAQVPFWKARWDTAKEMLKQIDPGAIVRFSHTMGTPIYVEYYDLSGEAGLHYLDAWGAEAIADITSMGEDFRTAAEPVPKARQDITIMSEDFLNRLLDRAKIDWGETIPFISGWWPSKHDFRIHNWKPEFIAYVTSLLARSKGEVYWKGLYGVGNMAWIYPPTADEWRSGLLEQREEAETKYHSLYTQLRDAKDELERAYRRLWDAKAAKERYELAITRAIALRQAEVDAAKARYELELRTLDNLKATYEVLLKEIDLAKAQAIAEAARQREEVIRAKEKDRLAIAEEQRRIAEEAERMAAETAGTTREEWLDKMRIALELAKDAEEAAILAAGEREAIARDIAIKKLELAQIELELEELRKQQEIAEDRKEEVEKEIVRVYGFPGWVWPVLGIVGAGAGAVGIWLALKKKKKKK